MGDCDEVKNILSILGLQMIIWGVQCLYKASI